MKISIPVLFFIISIHPFISNAQCGTDPGTGLVTISSPLQIVNSYYPGQGNPVMGDMSLTIGSIDTRGSLTALAAGDLILIIQIQGADINAANSDSYGNGTSGGTASGYLAANLYAGNYEYNSIASVAGSTINMSYSLANNYYTRNFASGPIRSYQVIRIPRYYDLTITASNSVTCPAWNGSTGGIAVLDAANVLTINGSINVSARGFRGGGGINLTGATAGNTNGSGTLTNTDYRWNSPVTTAANLTGGAKGEGIAGTPVYVLNPGSTTITTGTVEGYTNGAMGRAAPANAGGGGTDGTPVGASQNRFNSGGGGGSNAGSGGQGGSGWHNGVGNVNTYPVGGHGGSAFTQRSIQRFIMGGGGGAGTANNSTAANQYMSSGGAGGGIILIRASSYAGNGSLNANGGNATGVTGGGGNTDAAGGGGAGGTIIAVTRQNVTVGLNSVTATARGGNGGNMETHFDHGPGGGGGGGFIITNGAFASTNITGGANGLTRTGSAGGPINNIYGSTAGSNGELQTLTQAPILKNANNAASPCGTLPITLLSFSASANGSSVLLKWEVTEVFNFSHFEVEHGTASSFRPIGQVAFDPSQSHYQYSHLTNAPINYYRLKMMNIDGTAKYSRILLVKTGNQQAGLNTYPLPANDYIVVNATAQRLQRAPFTIFNTSGTKVKEIIKELNTGNNSFDINNLGHLSPGTYILQAYIDGRLFNSKIVLHR